jgi:hypothetical protein
MQVTWFSVQTEQASVRVLKPIHEVFEVSKEATTLLCGKCVQQDQVELLFAFGGVSLLLHLASFAWGAGTSCFVPTSQL